MDLKKVYGEMYDETFVKGRAPIVPSASSAEAATEDREASQLVGSGSLVRCCASCACWRPEIMECRYAPGEAAPPEAGCDGWIKGKPSHWLSRVTQRAAPNVGDEPRAGSALTPKK